MDIRSQMFSREFLTEMLNRVGSDSGKSTRCPTCGHWNDHIEEHDALLHYAPCDYCDEDHATCGHRD